MTPSDWAALAVSVTTLVGVLAIAVKQIDNAYNIYPTLVVRELF
jgi:hypothetical protein